MNVVGKVGSLIQQGVYSVATPFHPFGGAVDIIVVQQQDGSFRSTPWYVQFGKFQGVLKGTEKMVRINVNGAEADFHMFLDNSGEAYFVREADLGQDSDKSQVTTDEREGALEHSLSVDNSQCNINNDNVENYRLQSTLSDPGVFRDDFSSFRSDRLDRTDSDVCRFYDFQDDQSFEGELSPEYGSSRYDNIDAMENYVEAQGADSEMVLVSVDGHILTAPISSSEQNTENVQLVTPQFHLGPGEGNGFCESEREFTVGESTWDSEYINDPDASSTKLDSVIASCENNKARSSVNLANYGKFEEHERLDQVADSLNQLEVRHEESKDFHASESCKQDEEHAQNISVLEVSEEFGKGDSQGKEKGDIHKPETDEEDGKYVHENHEVANLYHLDDCEEEEEHAHQDQDADSTKSQERDVYVRSDFEDVSPSVKNEKFRSCLDLTTATVDEPSQCEDSSLVAQAEDKVLEERPSQNVHVSKNTETEHIRESVDNNINDGSIADVKPDVDLSPSDSDFPVSTSFPTRSHEVSEWMIRAQIGIGDNNSECTSVGNASLYKDEEVSPLVDTTKGTVGKDATEPPLNRSEVVNPHSRSSSKQGQVQISTIEISLCRHLLHPGMGFDAADDIFDSHRVSKEDFKNSAASVIKNENLVIRYKGKYFPWDQAAPVVLGMAAFGLELSIESKDAIPVEQQLTPKAGENDSGSASGRKWRLWPIAFRRVKTVQHSNSSSSEEVFVDPETVSQIPSIDLTPRSQSGTPRSATSLKSPHKKIVRTNIPTNEQIESLNLKEGQNDVTFSYSTRVLGLQQVEAHIYLWRWNARIVISDVDGTITKSDVLGQFMPLVGKDWSQSGVARLFSAIKENGYQLLFLSARAIVQAYLTKSFLFNLKQDGKSLPNGPVVISPNGLFPSLFREVIRRAPHEFKIACLEDIKALFPPDYNPFYAGFGNRDTDELTYRKIGIPKGKIFIINPKGEVAINHRIDVKSYTSLHTLVNDMFPPTSMVEQEDYNSWNYWKMPMPDVDD